MFELFPTRLFRTLLLLTALAAGGLAGAAQAQTAAQSPDRPVVYLVPFGGVPQELVEQIAAHIEQAHGLTVSKQHRKSLTKQMLDYLRRQVPAHELIGFMEPRYLRAAKAGKAIYLGLTAYDMYIEGVDWEFAFAARKPPGVAVVSTYRMDPVSYGEVDNPSVTLARAKKMVSKMIGHLHLGLADSDDPGNLMYGRVRSLADLDRLGDRP